ncbi:MAG: hypothetical protein ACI80W_001655, partial [Porticoccaceae bacterium]
PMPGDGVLSDDGADDDLGNYSDDSH